MITLGRRVKDQISGFKGIAVGRAEYVNAGIKILVAAQELNSGVPIADQWIDEIRLIELDESSPLSGIGYTRK